MMTGSYDYSLTTQFAVCAKKLQFTTTTRPSCPQYAQWYDGGLGANQAPYIP